MNRADFLLEIGCEEIPARMLRSAALDLAERVVGALDAAGLSRGESRSFCTPRRLAVSVRDVALRQADREEEVTGPPAKSASGPDGKPTKAALGFAQKMGLEVSDLVRIATPKGEYLGVRRRVPGLGAAEVLASVLPRSITGMSFPKTMRWGDGTRRFVRPVHWIVALLGDEIVPLEVFGVRAAGLSAGHRILGARGVPIPSASEYETVLLAQGVAADRDERRRRLSRRLIDLAGEAGVRPVQDPALLEEVADLVEYPGAVLGSFPAEFLSLPREVLITTLRHHQKSFSTETDDGLSNRFLVVADAERDAEGHIRKGNEWVVAGRLEDARFFFEEDRKSPLADRFVKLEHVTFHASAGSYADKCRRIEMIALALAAKVNSRARVVAARRIQEPRTPGRRVGEAASIAASREPDAAGQGCGPVDAEVLREAVRLAKCDLTTGLVGEFPELQGVAGGLYVRAETNRGSARHLPGIAEAIYDHYRPAGAGDELPRTSEGILLALADRLDTLVALARCVGLPTGSKDPFGLRRAAYGVVRIAAETLLPLTLEELLQAAHHACEGISTGGTPASAPPAKLAETLEFLLDRLQFWLKEQGSRYDTVNAVLLGQGGARVRTDSIPRLVEKVFALERLRDLPDSAALVEIHKRCRNILGQAEGLDPSSTLDTELKADADEGAALAALTEQVAGAELDVGAAMGSDDFEGALRKLVGLRPALTRFFDHVLVMHPDPTVRRQRLDLVRRTAIMIENVADLRQISISREDLQKLLGQLQTG